MLYTIYTLVYILFTDKIIKKTLPSTYSPLFSTGAPSNITVACCGAYAKMGVFLPVLRTPFRVRLYAALCEHMLPIAVHKA